MKTIKKIIRILFKTLKWAFLVFVGLAVISALYNLTLPKKSKTVSYLSANEKAFIAELMNLKQKLGNEVWPGWGDLHIPVILYNENYAFLIDYPDPPAGWLKMPAEEFRGTGWEVVETDKFYGKPYYRQVLPDPDVTPENFTVKVGDRWVATMQTKEYAAVAFYKGFKEELPPLLNVIFPYKIFWNILMGKAENYVGGMAHEAFHAFQGNKVPLRFAEGENISHLSAEYPWNDTVNAYGWIEETNLLIEAYHAKTEEDVKHFVGMFLERRTERRENVPLPVEMIQYEQKREWLEGLAKYAELKIGILAQESKNYAPVAEIELIPEFKNYKGRITDFRKQIEEVKRTVNRTGESRFYYVGMLQAIILDRLMPNWKNEAFNEGGYLDNLLKKSIEHY